jgi:predicted Rossmann fold nucleotide-binding protein DprA/Smf involved in DNA uptake
VLVLRAGYLSGTRFTVQYAQKQGRPVLAVPNLLESDGEYCAELIRTKQALTCSGLADVFEAIGHTGYESHRPPAVDVPHTPVSALSANAQAAFAKLTPEGVCFDDLIVDLSMQPGQLLSALSELTSSGNAQEHSARRFVRV